MKIKTVLVCLMLLCAFAFAQSKPTALTGVWKVSKVQTTGPNASTNASPQPSLYVFTAGYYTVLSVNGDKPRPALPQPATNATAAELNAAWGPFTANGGTYDVSGNTLTTHPTVAKNPGVMVPGAVNTFTFKVEGKSLTLTSATNTQGKVANPTTLTLTRVE